MTRLGRILAEIEDTSVPLGRAIADAQAELAGLRRARVAQSNAPTPVMVAGLCCGWDRDAADAAEIELVLRIDALRQWLRVERWCNGNG